MPVHALEPQPDTEGRDIDQLTVLYKALADQLRLQILRLLRNESFGVMELCQILEIKQSALSHHLKILIDAGLLNRRKEGTAIFYRRALAEHREGANEIHLNDEGELGDIEGTFAANGT